MLLTLAVSSLKSMLRAATSDAKHLAPLDVPKFAREELGLHALNIPAWMLSGWRVSDLEKLRDVADKAGCPCLLLVDDELLELGANGEKTKANAMARFGALANAANRLGCNAVAIGCKGPATANDEIFDRTAATLKGAFSAVDRLELNVLLRPAAGMLEDPVRLTELIKRVGGFRIGSLPDFGHAKKSGQPEVTLRKLAPYAGAIHATVEGFAPDGTHKGCDLLSCVEAIQSVGYQNTLAIEFVGSGDPVEAIKRARELLSEAIEGSSESDDILGDVLAAALGGEDVEEVKDEDGKDQERDEEKDEEDEEDGKDVGDAEKEDEKA